MAIMSNILLLCIGTLLHAFVNAGCQMLIAD